MAKLTHQFVCQECGHAHGRWAGRCEGCGAWNTLVEEVSRTAPKKTGAHKAGCQVTSLKTSEPPQPRVMVGIPEFDRVCGGGIVPGSVILVGGDPGIGKSTILLQLVAKLAQTVPTLYVSGEESLDQIRRRAQRLQVAEAPVMLAASTEVGDILAAADKIPKLALMVIDSIQTMRLEALDAAPGTVSQVRASAHELIRVAKQRGVSVILVGHVTKEGTLAGPRVLEHMVDTVLYFEGDRGHHFRLLRAVKNRFGPCNEIGVFEMTQTGLRDVMNPSALFLADRDAHVSGSVVFAGIEGTRPMLIEIQALVVATSFGTPRRAVVGWDLNRLNMILAVFEARAGLSFSNKDVFLNIVGGLKIQEPAADVAVAAALLSAFYKSPAPESAVFFGEIGLSGEVRAVGQDEMRRRESNKLGFSVCCAPRPPSSARDVDSEQAAPATPRPIKHLRDIVAIFNHSQKITDTEQ